MEARLEIGSLLRSCQSAGLCVAEWEARTDVQYWGNNEKTNLQVVETICAFWIWKIAKNLMARPATQISLLGLRIDQVMMGVTQ